MYSLLFSEEFASCALDPRNRGLGSVSWSETRGYEGPALAGDLPDSKWLPMRTVAFNG